jgi:hypothetical protein
MDSQARSVLLWWRRVGPANSIVRTRRARALRSDSASSRVTAPGEIHVEDGAEPEIVEPTDAIVRLAATCTCGSDLWPPP